MDNHLKPSVAVRYVAEQNRTAASFGETKSPDFIIADLAIAYEINPFIALQMQANNLFNQTYYEHLTRSVKASSSPIYAPGSSISLTLTVHW